MFLRPHARRIIGTIRKNPELHNRLLDVYVNAGPGAIPIYLTALDLCGPDEGIESWRSNPYEFLILVLSRMKAPELVPKVLRDLPRARRPAALTAAVAGLGRDEC